MPPGRQPGVTTEDKTRIAELEREVRELRRANAILKSASAFFAAELDRPLTSLITYIDQDKDVHGVEPICRTLTGAGAKIAPSTYYAGQDPPTVGASCCRRSPG